MIIVRAAGQFAAHEPVLATHPGAGPGATHPGATHPGARHPGTDPGRGPGGRGCPASRVTGNRDHAGARAGHHDAYQFPGRHRPWQRQRHRAGGA
jgi:hypothetical protein